MHHKQTPHQSHPQHTWKVHHAHPAHIPKHHKAFHPRRMRFMPMRPSPFMVKKKAERQRRKNLEAMHDSLRASVRRPLEWHPMHYSGGAAALFLESNWTSPDGIARVVLQCNVLHRGKPTAALLWTEEGLQFFDLSTLPLAEAVKRGRVFMFAATVSFEDGECFAVRQAAFKEEEHSNPGLWSFATVAAYGGSIFMLGDGDVGTLVGSDRKPWLVARPSQRDAKYGWLWSGRSSVSSQQGKLKFVVDGPKGSDEKLAFWLKPHQQHPQCSVLRCAQVDSNHDPIAIFNPNAASGAPRLSPEIVCTVLKRGGREYVVARANQRHAQGRAYFAARAHESELGESVITVRHEEGGEVNLLANHRDAQGAAWYVQYSTHQDENGTPMIQVELDPEDPEEAPSAPAAITIEKVGNKLFLLARPNRKDGQGRLLFAQQAQKLESGQYGVSVDYLEDGEEQTLEILANQRDARGVAWLAFHANFTDPRSRTPLIRQELDTD
jgi:hypothetical protein